MEIKVMKNILDVNNQIASANRAWFQERHITAINVMASPGSGKTSLIMKVIDALGKQRGIGVIEGDIASSIDARTIEQRGIPVVQINTNGGCHLDANMIKTSLPVLNLPDGALLFIENVGNLVCPAAYQMGESHKLLIASVPEGHDKPYKYTTMFAVADVIVLNKIDLAPYVDFDRDAFMKGVRSLNQKAAVFEVSCRTGAGLPEFMQWLLKPA